VMVVMAWWWLHLPIHCIWRLSTSFNMSSVDVGAILCWVIASATMIALFVAQLCHRFELSFQIWANTCGGTGMMMAPYAHPLHMKVVNQRLYVICGCGNHSSMLV
jgi:hypothetical protein